MVASDDLVAAVEDALRGASELINLHAAADKLRSRPDRILAKIRFIREDADLLEALAARSLRHSNGFTKVKLIAKDEYSVRLHLWPASTADRGETNPHGHRWEFASWVVCGEGMVERTYVGSDPCDPSAHAYDLYEFGMSPGGGRTLTPRHGAWLTGLEPVARRAGEIYVCPEDIIHTAAPAGQDFVATIVVQGNERKRTAPVYAPFRRCPKTRDEKVTVEQLRADLITLEGMLERKIVEDGRPHAVGHAPRPSPGPGRLAA
jgi:hypothetical protein